MPPARIAKITPGHKPQERVVLTLATSYKCCGQMANAMTAPTIRGQPKIRGTALQKRAPRYKESQSLEAVGIAQNTQGLK